MKKLNKNIEVVFLNPYEAEITRRVHGLEKVVSNLDDNAILKEGENVRFCSRLEIINFIQEQNRSKKLAKGIKENLPDEQIYIFDIKESDDEITRIKINIPSHLYENDHNLQYQAKALDFVTSINIRNIRKKRIQAVLATGVLLVAGTALGSVTVNAFVKEQENNAKMNQEYVDYLRNESRKNGYDFDNNTYYVDETEQSKTR